jgi:hypothetical protein
MAHTQHDVTQKGGAAGAARRSVGQNRKADPHDH